MRASSKRLYTILLSIVFLIGALYVYASMTRPLFDELSRLRSERLSEQKSLGEFEEAFKTISSLLAQYEDMIGIQEKISASFPIGEDIPNLLNQVYGIGELNKTKFTSISLQYLPITHSETKATLKPVGTLKINLKFEGDYENMKSLLSYFETNIRILDIYSIKIDNKIPGRNPILSYDLSLKAYYQVSDIKQVSDIE